MISVLPVSVPTRLLAVGSGLVAAVALHRSTSSAQGLRSVISLFLGLPLLVFVFTIGRERNEPAFHIIFDLTAIHSISVALSVLAYRLSPVHPLAKYPGPIHLRISTVWMAHIVSEGRRHTYFRELHARYGDCVRYGEWSNHVIWRDE